MNFLKILLSSILLSYLLFGCASDKTHDQDKAKEPTELYREAGISLQKKDYKKSAELFAEIAYQYPYYKWAVKAQIMEIYAYYLNKDYDSVIPATENYMKMHPASSEIDYVYYIKALSYYEQIDIPYRDQSSTLDAKSAFTELKRRFPKSEYTKDAKIKLELIEDHLAAQEMIIGRYYLNKGNILAAINRFKVVIDDYSTTTYIEEALYRTTEAYLFLELKEDAKHYAALLGHNYPNSTWYKESYNLLIK